MTCTHPLLKVSDLHVCFNKDKSNYSVLHGIDLEVSKGEAFALVGESGSGKSVTALAILQLLGSSGKIVQGDISYEGESLLNKNTQELQLIRGKKIGMVFQDPMASLNPTLTIGWQIAESLIYHEHLSYPAARRQAIDLLNQVGISDSASRYKAYPFQISGGMQQRVMIAMALARSPSLLIADEPTTALDMTVQAQILGLLQKIKKEHRMSLLLITHDLGVVANICERVAVMQMGKIVETADVETLFYSPQHPYTRALLSAKQEQTHYEH